jgi:hypothetical protein
MFCSPHIKEKMALRAAVLNGTYLVQIDFFFIYMALLTMFSPKQHKNPKFSIEINISHNFLEERAGCVFETPDQD